MPVGNPDIVSWSASAVGLPGNSVRAFSSALRAASCRPWRFRARPSQVQAADDAGALVDPAPDRVGLQPQQLCHAHRSLVNEVVQWTTTKGHATGDAEVAAAVEPETLR